MNRRKAKERATWHIGYSSSHFLGNLEIENRRAYDVEETHLQCLKTN